MKRELIKCDICGKEQYSDEKHSEHSLHIRLKRAFTIWWWRREDREPRNLDICGECLTLIYSLAGADENAKTMHKIFKYRSVMCISDMEEFDDFLKKTAEKIDRYKDNHREIYKEEN